MIGQLSGLSLTLVAVIVGAAMVAGAVDIVRHPGWAWQQAGEPKIAYLILDLLIPLVGLGFYVLRARPKVVAAVGAGQTAGALQPEPDRPASPPPEPLAEDSLRATAAPTAPEPVPEPAPAPGPGRRPAPAASDPFTGFRELSGATHAPAGDEPAPAEPESLAISSTFFSPGAATRSIRRPLALARAYRPRQRTSLTEDEPETEPVPEPGMEPVLEPEPVAEVEPQPVAEVEPEAVTAPEPVAAAIAPQAPTVASGWKVDPTGRHQFRYWDGFHWTENVADDGEESRDAVSA